MCFVCSRITRKVVLDITPTEQVSQQEAAVRGHSTQSTIQSMGRIQPHPFLTTCLLYPCIFSPFQVDGMRSDGVNPDFDIKKGKYLQA
jgi:hypothetical protein